MNSTTLNLASPAQHANHNVNPTSNKQYTIDKEGDIILELTRQPVNKESNMTQATTKVDLLVSSHILRRGSTVFRMMLSHKNNFKEGEALKANSKQDKLTRIELPDDDARAMWELCSLIYHKTPESLESPSLSPR